MKTSKALRALRKPRLITTAVVITFAIAGIATIIATHAATSMVSVEAEIGAKTGGATLAPDQGASGGNAVKFNTDNTNPPPTGTGVDRFGIKEIYPSLAGGKNWVSKWDNNKARNLDGKIDPDDPWSNTTHSDDGHFSTDGKGVLKVTGFQPRLYINDPAKQDQWRNVEITMYFQRVKDDGTGWGGMVAIAHTNHGVTGNEEVDLCDTRGIGSRVRYDGTQDYEKETSHPESSPAQNQRVDGWTGQRNVWIGYKYMVYDLPNGNVKLETWLDAKNDGTWKKVSQFEDNGNNIGVGGVACKGGINPAMRLTAAPNRDGSEKGKPNIAVYFRSTSEDHNMELLYKNGSVREIAP